MKLKLQLIIESDSGQTEVVHEVTSWNVALCGQRLLG